MPSDMASIEHCLLSGGDLWQALIVHAVSIHQLLNAESAYGGATSQRIAVSNSCHTFFIIASFEIVF